MHLLRPNDTSRVLTHNYPVAVNIIFTLLLYYETDRIQDKIPLSPHLPPPASALCMHCICPLVPPIIPTYYLILYRQKPCSHIPCSGQHRQQHRIRSSRPDKTHIGYSRSGGSHKHRIRIEAAVAP